MPCEGRTAGESLLAVGIRALVGALAGMDPAVTSQRTAIAKRLKNLLEIFHEFADSQNIPCRNARTCEASRQCVHESAQSEQSAG